MLGGMKQSYGGLQIEEVETRQGAGDGKRIKKKCDIEQNGVCVAQLHFAASFPPDAPIDDAILQYLCPLVCTLTPPHFAYCLLGDVAGEANIQKASCSHDHTLSSEHNSLGFSRSNCLLVLNKL